MKRAIIMARVSSDEQAKGYSLDIQIEKLSSYCLNNEIQIIKIFREDHSAKDFRRPEFQKMLEFISSNKNKIDLLLFTTWDRFSRNVTESYAMLNRLESYQVEVQAIEQPLDLKVPENKMILSIYLVLPDIDNKRRSMKITEGVRKAKAEGRWLGKPPFGYSLTKDALKKPLIVPNEDAKLIRKIFERLAQGDNPTIIRKDCQMKGKYFAKSGFYTMIRNRLYAGEIFVKCNDVDDEKKEGFYVKGMHTPLIDQNLFYKVQQLINPAKNINYSKSHKLFSPEIPLRGFIKCGSCGGIMTASGSRSRNGNRHYYYHCNLCREVRLRAVDVHQKVESILGEIKLSKNAHELYNLMVKNLLETKQQQKKSPEKIYSEIKTNNNRIEKLENLLADEKIDAITFNKSATRYRNEIRILNEELSEKKESATQYKTNLEKGIDLLSKIDKFYNSSSIEIKRKLLGSIFPEKLFFTKENCRTAKINEAVKLILNTDKAFRKKNSGQLFKNLSLSANVELSGFEPLSKHHCHKLSTCLFHY